MLVTKACEDERRFVYFLECAHSSFLPLSAAPFDRMQDCVTDRVTRGPDPSLIQIPSPVCPETESRPSKKFNRFQNKTETLKKRFHDREPVSSTTTVVNG